MKKQTVYSKYCKRIIDLFIALLLILALSPILMIIALLIKIKLGSPVIFKQKRPGKNGKIFEIYKFRTMTNEKDKFGEYLPFDERVTSFGIRLRKTSLDELPSLFNIVKGEMSFVGPRPLLVSYLDYYDDDQMQRHSVRPGLTGLAQVSGRNNLEWEKRFKLDLQYVNDINFANDLLILIKTVAKVFKREDISTDQHSLKNFDIYTLDKLQVSSITEKILLEQKNKIIEMMILSKDKNEEDYCSSKNKFDKMYSNLKRGKCSIYGYILNNEVIGFVQFFEYKKNTFTGVHINRIVINQKFRGKGLGKRLIEFIDAKYSNQNLGLEVNKNNSRAITFYKSNGFIITDYNSACKSGKYYMILER